MIPLSPSEKLTILLSGTEAKINVLLDISRLLDRDASISEVANDFQTYGTSLEKLIGKRLSIANRNAYPTHKALDGVISDMSLEAIKTGEETGKLAEGFLSAKEAVEKNEGLFGSLISGFVWPIVKILVVIIGLSLLGTYIFDQMADLVPYRKWPSLSQTMYQYSNMVSRNSIGIVTFVFLTMITTGFLCKYYTGLLRRWLDKLPYFKQYRILNASLTLTSLEILIRADQPILSAINFLEKRTTAYIKWHLTMMRKNIQLVKNGGTIGQMLDTGLINTREVNRLSRAIAENETADRIEESAKDHYIQLKRQISRINTSTKYLFLIVLIGNIFSLFASVFFLVLSISTI